jgi:hypothetical protein
MMSYSNLGEYYSISFRLHRDHNYSMEHLDSLIPFERDIYVDMVLNAMNEDKEAAQKQR